MHSFKNYQRRLIHIFAAFLLSFTLAQAQEPIPKPNSWSKAVGQWNWAFPRDHGAHQDFQTEWWYFTGNLQDAQGRPFGYQLTFFRQGLIKNPTQKSAWALRDVYFAHFALSDIQSKKFHFFERADRGALGLADYSEAKMDIRLQDWNVTQTGPDEFKISAQDRDVQLELTLQADKPKTFQGNKGLSQKSQEIGNASYYYSYTRLKSQGVIKLKNETFAVTGNSWFDHEFSSSFLAENHVGWDWFSIQLESGEDLMVYNLRLKEGGADPYSHGSLVEKDGTKIDLKSGDYQITANDFWRSKKSGGRYPVQWVLKIPSKNLDLDITAAFPEQELRLKQLADLTYWEGSCVVSGSRNGQKVKGRAYVEMTGYSGSLRAQSRVTDLNQK